MPGSQNSMAQMRANNAAARAALLATSPRYSKELGSFTSGALGGSTRVKLFNVGIITRLLLKVSTTIDIAAGGATISNGGPYNLIKRLRLTDFDGTDRVNLAGDELFLINCVRRGTYYGYNNESAQAVSPNPVVPINAGNTQALNFYIEVPVAFDPEADLRGAILAQTSVGELSLNIDWNTGYYNNGSDESIYNTANAVTQSAGTGITVEVYQDYLLPQNIGGQIALPELDLLTVYELNGAIRSSDNLNINTEKLINVPNVRSVIGAYTKFVNNGLQVSTIGASMLKHRIIANGSNVIYERSQDTQLFEQRLQLNSDTRQGWHFFMFRRKPLETALFGNVQIGQTPNVAITGNAYIGTAWESFYTKGSTLPGLAQASG